MSAENNVPAIRFQGFDGEWDERCLGEIGSLKNGMNFDKTAMGHGHPFVNLQDVFGKNEVSNNNLGLAFSTVNQRKEYSLNQGDVLFIRSSVKPEGVGEAAVISKSLENTTYSGFIIRFRPNVEMDVNFNRFVYSTANSRRQILASSTSSANSNINQDSLQRIQLALPSKEEQNKVGNYFQQLDTLIAQHQKKHDKLLNLKKSLLEKMLPKQGAIVPEIRFKGVSGKWEEKALQSIVEVLDGDRGHNYPNGDDLQTTGHTLFLSASNVTANGFKLGVTQYISEEKSNCLGNGKLVLNDIILTSRGSVGHIAWYNEHIEQQVAFVRINSGMLILRSKNHIAPSIIAQFLKSPAGKKKIDLISFGSAQPQLTKMSVSAYTVTIPSEKTEQTKIGNLFDQLDTLITQHQTQLKKLNNIKQACLEKMFV